MANSTMGSGTNIAAALEDNIHVREMFSILQDNGRDTSGLSALIDHIKGMEDFVKAAESQIGVMKSQLDTMKEVQDHPIRNVLQSTIKALETKVGQIKEQIGLLAAGVIEGCQKAVTAFKQKGISALDKVASFLGIKKGLQNIKKDCEHSIQRCNRSIAKIEGFSNEYHKAGRAIKNMARMFVGKPPIDTPKEAGKLAKAMCAPYRAEIACMKSLSNSADRAIARMEQLENTAENIRSNAATKPGLLDRLAANKDKIKELDLAMPAPGRLPKVAGAEI